MFQIQIETDPSVPGLNPARDYDIDRSESEMACHYLNSSTPGGSSAPYDIEPSDAPCCT